MSRPNRYRRVWREPRFRKFGPVGRRKASAVCLTVDEFEAIRLKDLEKISQKKAAEKMGISQPTFHRLLEKGHEKVARALTNGMAIEITGGNYVSKESIQKMKKSKKGVEDMEKIAVSTATGGLEDPVVPRFGRCSNFTLVEVENNEIKNTETVQNPGAQMAGGAGIQAAQAIVDAGADTVITGAVGPNVSAILIQADIDAYSASGVKVKDAVQSYLDGELTKIPLSNAPQFPGAGAGRGSGRGRAQGGQGQGSRGQGKGRQGGE